jgi:hypothetical protein
LETAVSTALKSLDIVSTSDVQRACPAFIVHNRICETLRRDVPEMRLVPILRSLGFWNRSEVISRSCKCVYVRDFSEGLRYVQLLSDINE